jgi:hypothetical protein
MGHGGARPNSGPRPGVRLPHVVDKGWASTLLAALNRKASKKDSYEIQHWRMLTEAEDLGTRFRALTYLYDQAHGKATQPVDHGAGGPIAVEITTNVKMADPHERS